MCHLFLHSSVSPAVWNFEVLVYLVRLRGSLCSTQILSRLWDLADAEKSAAMESTFVCDNGRIGFRGMIESLR